MRQLQNEQTLSPNHQKVIRRFGGNAFQRSCEKMKRFTCTSLCKNISEFPALKAYLPENYDYHVCDFDIIQKTEDHVDFKTAFRMVLSSKDDIQRWLKLHTVTWRVDRTYPTKGQKVIFKVDYRCQFNTRPRGPEKAPGNSKNTDCPAKMNVTLLRTQVSRGRRSLSADAHLPTFPTMVTLCNEHNHYLHAQARQAVPLHSTPALHLGFVECGLTAANGSPNMGYFSSCPEESGLEVVVEEVEQEAPEEAAHRVAALQFKTMCQKLSALVKSDKSFTASALAAVKAFRKMEGDPSKIATALHLFAREPPTRSSAVHGSARHKGGRRPLSAVRKLASGGRHRRLVVRTPSRTTMVLDHVYSQ
ncbi:uncharacterized protein LOC144181541 isoform X1 [Stigmatopora nigra]